MVLAGGAVKILLMSQTERLKAKAYRFDKNGRSIVRRSPYHISPEIVYYETVHGEMFHPMSFPKRNSQICR
jgi:hypothetical protein